MITFNKLKCALFNCLLLLYLETAFAICIGCKLYFPAIRLELLKKTEVTPNCMGRCLRDQVKLITL